MLESLLDVIKKGKTQKLVLARLKDKKAKVQQKDFSSYQGDLRPQTTLMIEAAKRGFLQVIKYLHIEWNLSVDEQSLQKRTPFMEACLANGLTGNTQEEVVEYLAALTTQVEGDMYGQTPFHYLTKTSSQIAISSLFERYPAQIRIQDIEGQTPLYQAAIEGNTTFVAFCAQQHVKCDVPDMNGITPFWSAYANGQAKVMQQLLTFPDMQVISPHGLTSMFESHCSFLANEHKNKVACLNILFSLGAGLELSHIPDGIFSALNIKREQLKEFLIIAEEDTGDGIFKKRIISSCEQLKIYLKNPKWRFKAQHLVNACHHPKLEQVAHIQKVQALLKEAYPHITPLLPNVAEYYQSAPAKKPMTIESKQALIDAFNKNIVLLNRYFTALQSRYLHRAQPTPIVKQYVFETPRYLNDYFACLNNFLGLGVVEGSEKLTLKDKSFFEHVVINFGHLFDMFFREFRNDPQSEYTKKFLAQMENNLRKILKRHGKIIKGKSTALYNSLYDALVTCCDLIARDNLKQGNLDVALNLAVEALKFANMMVIDNESLDQNMHHLRSRCYATMAEVFYAHGWMHKAARHINKAFEHNAKSQMMFDPTLLEMAEKLATFFLEKNKPDRSYHILKEALAALSLVHPFFADFSIADKQLSLGKLFEKAQTAFFTQRLKITQEYLKDAAFFDIDSQSKSITLTFAIKFAEGEISALLSEFLVRNPGCQFKANQLVLTRAQLFSDDYLDKLKEISTIINNYVQRQQQVLDKLMAEFMDLNLNSHKGKESNSEDSLAQAAETYGFDALPGFTPIVPMYSSGLPNHTLFFTMPQQDERFKPFYKFIEKGQGKDYEPVKTIASDGNNQQGAKLFTVNDSTGQKIARARLKVLGVNGKGKLRAQGAVEQTIRDPGGKLKKLYVFREVTEKKEEKRKTGSALLK